MGNTDFPLTKSQLEGLIKEFPTPFHIYSAPRIRENAERLKEAFGWLGSDFKEFFAVKACPNNKIVRVTKQMGFGTDCSSMPELTISEREGVVGEDVMFTSNETPASEFKKARKLGAIINLDDITHIPFLEKHAGIPDLISFRYNPGPLREGNSIIGNPEEAKYGLTKPQIFEAFGIMKNKGVKRFGLHTMIASNGLNPQYFIDTADMLVDLVQEVSNEKGIKFEFINIGGGIGIPYKLEDEDVDLNVVSKGVQDVFSEKVAGTDNQGLKLFMENGRMVTGPYGWLVTTAVHEKHTYRDYIGVDAAMHNLMRPALYGAYHKITVAGKEDAPLDHIYDVVGSLCENNDKFAIQRQMPKIDIGDKLIIHNAGAHGYAMGFNYNGKLRSAELLLNGVGDVEQIRRAETEADYLATLDFD